MHLSYRWQATLVIALGLLMAVLDSTIVSVVLPQIATSFHTDYLGRHRLLPGECGRYSHRWLPK
jgi:MFS family permease